MLISPWPAAAALIGLLATIAVWIEMVVLATSGSSLFVRLWLERLTKVVWNVPRVRHGDHAARPVHPPARVNPRPRVMGAARTAMPACVDTREAPT